MGVPKALATPNIASSEPTARIIFLQGHRSRQARRSRQPSFLSSDLPVVNVAACVPDRSSHMDDARCRLILKDTRTRRVSPAR